MTITGNVSLLAQSNAQSRRLVDLRRQMDDLSRQVTTQQKAEDYSGLGTDALALQNLNRQQPMLQSYLNNIKTVSNNMTLMNNALTSISKVGNDLVHAIQTQIQSGPDTIASIQQIARQGLHTIEDMINLDNNGRYLFAGSDAASPPFVDDGTLNSNITNQITAWLNTGDTATFNATVDAFSSANLGLAPGLSASGAVTARVDDNLNIDYTVKADDTGFKDLLRGLALVANLPYPSSTDVATGADFTDLMKHALASVQGAVQDINQSTQQLAGKFNLLKSVQTDHENDLQLVQTQIAQLETADPTQTMVQLQTLQTQLTASYQVTNIVSHMSLVDFL